MPKLSKLSNFELLCEHALLHQRFSKSRDPALVEEHEQVVEYLLMRGVMHVLEYGGAKDGLDGASQAYSLQKAVRRASQKYPALKVRDPGFFLALWRSERSAGVLSNVNRSSRVGKKHVLVSAERPLVYAFLKIGEGEVKESLRDLTTAEIVGVDNATRRAFGRSRRFWYHRVSSAGIFEQPLRLPRSVPGRMFAGLVDLSTAKLEGKPVSANTESVEEVESSWKPTAADLDEESFDLALEKKAADADPFAEVPSEDGTYDFVSQNHYMGKSVHWDLRFEGRGNEFLLGWTIDDMVSGSLPKVVDTLAEAKAFETKHAGAFKVSPKTGEFAKKPRPNASVPVRVVLLAERKARGPVSWLDLEGVVEHGPGTTKNYPGVFTTWDRGTIEFGAQRPDFHEYFLDGKLLKTRLIFRKADLPTPKVAHFEFVRSHFEATEEEPFLQTSLAADFVFKDDNLDQREAGDDPWFVVRPDDQRPYVLSPKAVRTAWVPDHGFSALPKSIRSKVPESLRYWERVNVNERIDLRHKLVQELAASIV